MFLLSISSIPLHNLTVRHSDVKTQIPRHSMHCTWGFAIIEREVEDLFYRPRAIARSPVILIFNKTVSFIKKAPPYGVADFVIFELKNHEIRLMLFLTCLRHYKKVFKPFYQKHV